MNKRADARRDERQIANRCDARERKKFGIESYKKYFFMDG
jgi:hypothetical protein